MKRRTDVQKILVLCLAGAGDALMATPLFKELRLGFPEAKVDAVVMQGRAAVDVLTGNPNVDEIFYHNFMRESLWASWRFCSRLRWLKYDLLLMPMPQNRLEYNLVAWLIGARERLGFNYHIRCGALGNLLLTKLVAEDTQAHVVTNNLRLFSEGLGLPLQEQKHKLELFLGAEDWSWADRFLEGHKLAGRVLVGFHPGSGVTKNLMLRRWPAAYWSELARLLAEDPRVTILLYGSDEELALREEILAAAGLAPERMIIVRTKNVKETAALIARMACLVCNDALLMHLAAALAVPSVVVVGPTPSSSYPYNVEHRVVRLSLSCSPCYGYSRYGIRCTNARLMKCIREIKPAMVLAAVQDLLGAGAR